MKCAEWLRLSQIWSAVCAIIAELYSASLAKICAPLRDSDCISDIFFELLFCYAVIAEMEWHIFWELNFIYCTNFAYVQESMINTILSWPIFMDSYQNILSFIQSFCMNSLCKYLRDDSIHMHTSIILSWWSFWFAIPIDWWNNLTILLSMELDFSFTWEHAWCHQCLDIPFSVLRIEVQLLFS